MNNFLKDVVFGNFVYSCEFSICQKEVLNACLQLPDRYSGVVFSNRQGWQSPGFKGRAPYDILDELAREALVFSNEVGRLEQLNTGFDVETFWVNINNAAAYNVAHAHPGADLVVVYYAKVPPHSGDLVLVRNDGGVISRLLTKKPAQFHFNISPQAGRAYAFPAWLLHYVEASQAEDLRVSVSFNVKCLET
jgi:hypothetical protein